LYPEDDDHDNQDHRGDLVAMRASDTGPAMAMLNNKAST
jgi:hypothetical protein